MGEQIKNEITLDKVKIADEVIETIAGIAASKVAHVSALSGGLSDGIAGILGRRNPGKGVKVDAGNGEVKIDLSVIVDYGSMIHKVAKEIQCNVREEIEHMTGLIVTDVNVNIVGIKFEKEGKKDEVSLTEDAL